MATVDDAAAAAAVDPLEHEPLGSLSMLVKNATGFITAFEAPLLAISSNKPSAPALSLPPSSQDAHPLALAHDSATLIRAHTTKLSLFITNDPFTPTEIVKLLAKAVPEAVPAGSPLHKSLIRRKALGKKETAGPITGLASASHLCDPDKFTQTFRRELTYHAYDILRKFKSLVSAIPLDGKVLSSGDAKTAVMPMTGNIWAACDETINLKKLGIAGFLAQKCISYRDDTLKDILDELKECRQDMDDDENDNDNDPNRIRDRLDSCLKKLQDTMTLYTEVAHRRLKTLPPLTGNESQAAMVKRLNDVLPLLRDLPEKFNDLGCTFQDQEEGLDFGDEFSDDDDGEEEEEAAPTAPPAPPHEPDVAEIDRFMDECFLDAFTISEILARPWQGGGQRDKFTKFAEDFKTIIKTPL